MIGFGRLGSMNQRPRRLFLSLGLLALTGCGDSADSLLRTATNYRCELTDRLIKVNDEQSAKKFVDHDMKVYAEKLKNLDDKWVKWIKDIEDPYRKKQYKVVNIQSKSEQGTDQWEEDLFNAPGGKEEDIAPTRKAFAAYVRKVAADDIQFQRERERIKALVDHLEPEEKEKAVSLAKIAEADTFKNLLVSGAGKKIVAREE
jgi:hypothetical protein